MAKIITIIIFILSFLCSFAQEEKDISKYFEESKDREVATKNILKLNYLRGALNGNAVIAYERYISPLLSVEAEVGLTYWDFMGNAINSIFFDDLVTGQYKLGYSAGAGIRIYPKKNEMDGFYINPHYRYVRYNYLVSKNKNFYNRFHNHDMLGIVGYQILYGKVSLDYYAGLGVRMLQTRRNEEQDNDAIIVVKQSKIMPQLALGFKFGIIF